MIKISKKKYDALVRVCDSIDNYCYKSLARDLFIGANALIWMFGLIALIVVING